MKQVFWTMLAAILLSGCAKQNETETTQTNAPVKKESSARTLVNGLTGRAAVNAGKEARGTLEAVSAEQNKNLDEIMGEQ